jgi:integrase
MARKYPDEPTFDSGRKRWKAQIPASLSTTGKRCRAWFPTRDKARSWIASQVSTAEPSSTIPPALALKADEARLVLDPFGLDLLEGAKQLATALQALGSTGTLLQAATAWKAAHDARSASRAFLEAAELFLQTRDGLREATVRGYKWHLLRAMEPLHTVTLADLTGAQINTVLATRPASSRKAIQTTISTFIRWAASPPRQWCSVAILEAMEPVRISRDGEIHVLAPEAAAALLKAAESVSPGAAVAFAVAIFGGVRLVELSKLTWKNILADHIEITAEIAKRHARRLVPICPTLRAWLDAYRGGAEDDSPITGPNWIRNYETTRRIAGWAVQAPLAPEGLPEPTRGEWPRNVCRHTCASIQVATGRPLDELLFSFGHSGGTAILKQHYLGQLTKAQAIAILSIGPNGSEISNLSAA